MCELGPFRCSAVSDYIPLSTTVSFDVGEGATTSVTKTISISTVFDDLQEETETFLVKADVFDPTIESNGRPQGLFGNGSPFGSRTTTAIITIINVEQGEVTT